MLDLATLALVLDAGVRVKEAGMTDLVVLREMRDTALRLMSASSERRDALLTELIEEVTGDADGS